MKKIPAKWYEPNGADRQAPWLKRVVAGLRIEAAMYAQAGNHEGAKVVRTIAHNMTLVIDGKSYAQAFDWPAHPEIGYGK